MRIKIGNSVTLRTLVRDQDGTIITNLASAEEIYFMCKKEQIDDDSAAIISKKETLGEILVDSPSVGYLSIALDSTDTTITPEILYTMIEVRYSATNKVELNLMEDGKLIKQVDFYQDGIRGN